MFFSQLFTAKPFNQGYLPEKDGHQVYFMEFGNKKGKPIFVTHGGPGGSCKAKNAKYFDLKKYRVIMMDQRGCGQSLPSGKVEHNTTDDTISDINRLFEYLNIKEKVIMRGGSWGSTIVMLYAERYPEKVDKLLLSQLFLADAENIYWGEHEVVKFYPDMWKKITQPVAKDESFAAYYFKKLNSSNVEEQQEALNLYCGYEFLLGQVNPQFMPVELNEKTLSSAKISAHYMKNDYFLADNEIMNNVAKIANIPTLIVHNRLDFLCPLSGAYKLAERLNKADLVIVPSQGHVSKMLYKRIEQEIKRFLSAN